MTRTLGWIAAIGLGVGAVSLTIAYALGGHDLERLIHRGVADAHSSDPGTVSADGTSERHFAWDGDTIEIALGTTVRFKGGEGSDIVVRGSPNAVSRVEVRGNRLVYGGGWFGPSGHLEVTLPGHAFRRIALAGSGKLIMENVSQPELSLQISGSGDVQAKGTVNRLAVEIAGSGDARLGDLAANELEARVSGSGKIEAAPKASADVHISGSGDVRLLTHPDRLSTHISGSGRIRQAATDERK